MRYIEITVVGLAFVYLLNLWAKKKPKPIYYIILFIIFLCTTWFTHKLEGAEIFDDTSYSYETPCAVPNAKKEIAMLSQYFPLMALTASEKQFYAEKLNFHIANAERTFNDAKNKCWYLPEKTKRDAAKYCINSVACLLVPGSPYSKIIASLISMLKDVGVDMMDEWNYINNKLYWCHYHYEMVEFYLTVLEKG